MMPDEITKLETKHAKYGVRGIESEAKGLHYLIDNDKRGIMISGTRGMTLLSIRQARALQNEIGGILDDLDYYTGKEPRR